MADELPLVVADKFARDHSHRADTGFTVTSAGLPGVQRNFTSFSAAVLQIENARIYAGFHFRFSVVDGATLGAEVSQYILENTALPLHGRDLGQLRGP